MNLIITSNIKPKFDSEKNIIIYLLNTKVGSAKKLTRINDKLVKTVALEENENSLYIKTTLIKSATFTVFSLSSPFRIVIDIIPVEKFSTSGPISVESVNELAELEKQDQNVTTLISKQEAGGIKKENVNQPQVQIEEGDDKSILQVNSKLDFLYSKLKNENFMLFQIALDLVFTIVLSIMGISFYTI